MSGKWKIKDFDDGTYIIDADGTRIAPVEGMDVNFVMPVIKTHNAAIDGASAGVDQEPEEKYPMSDDQDAQVDCRRTECQYYGGYGKCENISPALTLNPDKTYVCWSSNKLEKAAVDQQPEDIDKPEGTSHPISDECKILLRLEELGNKLHESLTGYSMTGVKVKKQEEPLILGQEWEFEGGNDTLERRNQVLGICHKCEKDVYRDTAFIHFYPNLYHFHCYDQDDKPDPPSESNNKHDDKP